MWTLRQALQFDAGRHLLASPGRGKPWNVVVEVDLDDLGPKGLAGNLDVIEATVKQLDDSCIQEAASLGNFESLPAPEQVLMALRGLVERAVVRKCSVRVIADIEGRGTVTLRL